MQAQKCRARFDHLESADTDNLSEWNNTRLNRILVDYMLRMSYYDTAMKLVESSNLQVRGLPVLMFQFNLTQFLWVYVNNFISSTILFNISIGFRSLERCLRYDELDLKIFAIVFHYSTPFETLPS